VTSSILVHSLPAQFFKGICSGGMCVRVLMPDHIFNAQPWTFLSFLNVEEHKKVYFTKKIMGPCLRRALFQDQQHPGGWSGGSPCRYHQWIRASYRWNTKRCRHEAATTGRKDGVTSRTGTAICARRISVVRIIIGGHRPLIRASIGRAVVGSTPCESLSDGHVME
jgi:hypothetical protein